MEIIICKIVSKELGIDYFIIHWNCYPYKTDNFSDFLVGTLKINYTYSENKKKLWSVAKCLTIGKEMCKL